MTSSSKPGDGITKRLQPKPRHAISYTKVMVALGCLSVFIVCAIFFGKGPSEIKQLATSDMKASLGYAVTTLPETYADLPPPPPNPGPEIRYIEKNSNDGELARLLLQMEAEARARTLAARKASLSFQGVSIANASQSEASGTFGAPDTESETSEGAASNPRDEANRQDDKNNFLRESKGSKDRLLTRLRSPRSEYELLAGTLIPGVLLTGLNSDLPGQILGQVSQNVFDTVTGRYVLLPQGTKVIGQYDSRIVYGQERVLIVWTRLILPNGRSISLEGMPGVDLTGYAGLSDQINNHYWRLLTGVIFSSVLGASAQLAEGRNYSSVDPSYGELATQGFARNMNDVGQQVTRKNLNVQPTLEIRPGFRFNVFVHKDIVLEPYES